jgi:hypothetical protein
MKLFSIVSSMNEFYQGTFFVETCAIKKGDFGLWPNFAFFAFFAKDLSDDVMKLNSAGSRHAIATF